MVGATGRTGHGCNDDRLVGLRLAGMDRDDCNGRAGFGIETQASTTAKMERGDGGGCNSCAVVWAVSDDIGGGVNEDQFF